MSVGRERQRPDVGEGATISLWIKEACSDVTHVPGHDPDRRGARGRAGTGELAAPEFVNGLALPGDMLDESKGTDANTGRVGSSRTSTTTSSGSTGMGCPTADRAAARSTTRRVCQRFNLDIDKKTGAISKFKIVDTIIFKDELGQPLDGIAPNPTSQLGNSFDPEGFVVHPETQHFLVSDEYGPSLYEFDRHGVRVRTFTIPANLIPRNATTGTPNYAGDDGNTAGKRTNRGFEGLAISPDGALRLRDAPERHAGRGRRQRRVQPHRQVRHRDRRPQSRSTPTRWRARRRAAASPPWWPSTITSSSCSSATTGASASGRRSRRRTRRSTAST